MPPPTAIMVYEKTGRHGAAVTRAVGVGLVMLAGLFVLGSVLLGPGGSAHHHDALRLLVGA